ncbi:hypothetical protein Bca4012_020491 [Brassica carinata]
MDDLESSHPKDGRLSEMRMARHGRGFMAYIDRVTGSWSIIGMVVGFKAWKKYLMVEVDVDVDLAGN